MVFRHIAGKDLHRGGHARQHRPHPAARANLPSRSRPQVRGPANLFWVFHVIRDYARTLAPGQKPLRRRSRRVSQGSPTCSRTARSALPIVLGHHDLLPGNFLDDGERLWLIDWEYGGFGTPLFDLANIAANASFSDGEEVRLLEGYFGRPPTGELAAVVRRHEGGERAARSHVGHGLGAPSFGAGRRLRRPRRRIPPPHREAVARFEARHGKL